MRVDLTERQQPKPEHPQQPEDTPQTYNRLSGPARLLARMANRPVLVVYGLVVPVLIVSWAWLVFAAGQVSNMGEGHSRMSELAATAGLPQISAENGIAAYLLALFAPLNPVASISFSTALMIFLIWMVMSVAMMMPSATPMLRTYADIAEVAAEKQQFAVSIIVLAAGYLTIWLAFALVATLLQVALIIYGQAAGHAAPVSGIIGGLFLAIAGIYQFSSLKHACLVKCRNPFTIIFARWSTRPRDIFRLGLQQGLFCLGCCWALMLVMLSVGTMNIFWMGLLTLFTLIEKTSTGQMISRGMGTVLLAWGVYLMLNSVNLILM